MPSLLALPNELLLMIMEQWSMPDLDRKIVRLVCKRLDALVTPLLFAHLYVQSSEMSRLYHVAESPRLRTLVKGYSFLLQWPTEAEDCIVGCVQELNAHVHYIPMLSNLKGITIDTQPHPFLHEMMGSDRQAQAIAGLLDALYICKKRVDKNEGGPEIVEFNIGRINSVAMQYSSRVSAGAVEAMQKLKRVTFTGPDPSMLESDWMTFAGVLIAKSTELKELTVGGNYESVNQTSELWKLVIPHEHCCGQILKGESIKPEIMRFWPNLSILNLCGVQFWHRLFLAFLRRHKEQLRTVRILLNCILITERIDSLSGKYLYLDDECSLEHPDVCFVEFMRSFKNVMTPLLLNELEFDDMLFGASLVWDDYENLLWVPKCDMVHWAQWIMNKRRHEPVYGEQWISR
ncbi:hypothetical protein BZA05DRAFT_239547 [Tricharina praecox]|uniref:uncharacterized protein n=1 Tax=Tricharina praecox TaxID=43433 RepID=UPI00221FFE1C|nr:uncharacterized protein BZA05DRAFT_239547 [Tricharina praecox]KAI5855419.1 hypothetical protein BZA05DRAFT_239547 [Tricharina praecox]